MRKSGRTSGRTYLETHPWLTFEVDLRRLGQDLWMQLGAIQSKCEHIAKVMLPPTVGRQLLSLYLAKGVHATTAIEGNTLSEKQVRRRISTREPLPPSQEYQGKEVDNIVEACNVIATEMIERGVDCTVTPERIAWFNETVLKDLPVPEGVVPGKIRRHSVGVADYRGAPHEDCEFLLGRTCDWLNHLSPAEPEYRIALAVLRAALAHLYIAWIHPFGDGNGRTARLVEVQILLGAGVPMIAAHLLSNYYNQTRTEYYRILSMASKKSDPLPFVQYAIRGLFDQLNAQIARICRTQYAIAWKDYVYEQFASEKSSASHRQRQLALELGKRPQEVAIAAIRRLSPGLAEAYAGRTRKTVSRDVNRLVQMDLVARRRQAVRAKVGVLQTFLPRRRAEAKRQ